MSHNHLKLNLELFLSGFIVAMVTYKVEKTTQYNTTVVASTELRVVVMIDQITTERTTLSIKLDNCLTKTWDRLRGTARFKSITIASSRFGVRL